jgi:hypothetical protein
MLVRLKVKFPAKRQRSEKGAPEKKLKAIFGNLGFMG